MAIYETTVLKLSAQPYRWKVSKLPNDYFAGACNGGLALLSLTTLAVIGDLGAQPDLAGTNVSVYDASIIVSVVFDRDPGSRA